MADVWREQRVFLSELSLTFLEPQRILLFCMAQAMFAYKKVRCKMCSKSGFEFTISSMFEVIHQTRLIVSEYLSTRREGSYKYEVQHFSFNENIHWFFREVFKSTYFLRLYVWWTKVSTWRLQAAVGSVHVVVSSWSVLFSSSIFGDFYTQQLEAYISLS